MRRALYLSVWLIAAFLLVGAFVPAARGRQDRVAVLTLALAGCGWVRYRLGTGDRPEPPEAFAADGLGIADEQDVRLARLDASVAQAAESGQHYARAFVPMVRRLAAERLSDKAGIDVTADPSGARRLMGEELWEIFSTEADAGARPPGPERLRALVQHVERL